MIYFYNFYNNSEFCLTVENKVLSDFQFIFNANKI